MQTVIGFFNTASEAERAADHLRSNGISDQNIDVSTSHASMYRSGESDLSRSGNTIGGTSASSEYATSDDTRYSASDDMSTTDRNRSEHKDGDSFGDKVERFFKNLFGDNNEAERYASAGRNSCIVTVYAESSEEAERARDILDEHGAVDVDDQERSYGNYGNSTDSETINERKSVFGERSDVERSADLSDYDTRNTRDQEGVSDRSIPVIAENINVGKREVETGGVRVRSRIVERPVEENLRLREEHVRVERVNVDRPATDSDFETFREGEIELTETAEVPIVNKEARVIEEVRLVKDVEEREEKVRDTIRETEVNVENLTDENLKTRRNRKKS